MDNRDFLLLKYDADGDLRWSGTHDTGNEGDKAVGIALDNDGNPVIIGHSHDSETDSDRGLLVRYGKTTDP